jgi:hypothetical protein
MTTQIWGRALWIFFHTFGTKINQNFFNKNRIYILNTTQNLLRCIPCDMCKKHAIMYIKKNPLSNIKTKDNYISYFTIFHNEVNKLRKVDVFTNIHIYDNYNIQKVLLYFNKYYTYYRSNRNLFSQNTRRENVCNNVVAFINNNIEQFI